LHRRWKGFAWGLLSGVVFSAASLSQPAGKPPNLDPVVLIQRAAENETRALTAPPTFQYQERLEWGWGTETRAVIETSEGRADRIVLFDDEPLAGDQKSKQQRRLQKLLTDRDAFKDELEEQKAETQRRIRTIKAFASAFLFTFNERENGLLKFYFRPNPGFSPKDRETQMYRGMEGFLWLEPVQERIVRIEGKLVKDVAFGWGIFGRLYKGGIYEIAQSQVSPGIWRITTLNVHVKGRILFLNSFQFFRSESNTHFRPTPVAMTYHQAVETLLKSEPLAESQGNSHPYFNAAGCQHRSKPQQSSDSRLAGPIWERITSLPMCR